MKIPKIARQTLILVLSQVTMLVAGFGIKSLQTQYLGPELYGEYAFFASLTTFLVIFYRFGFFTSLQLLLAENAEKTQTLREIQGAGLVLALLNGVAFAGSLVLFSDFINAWSNTQIGDYFLALSPLLLVIPFRHFVSAISVGTNQTNLLALYDGASKVLFFVALLILIALDQFSVFSILLFNLASTAAFALFFLFKIDFTFHNLSSSFRLIWQKTKSYGFNMYTGLIANQGTFKLDELLIVQYTSTLLNGFYTLSALLCSPIVMFSQSLSNVLFKRFQSEDRIHPQILKINLLITAVLTVGLILVGSWVVNLLFGVEYGRVYTYLVPLSFAYFFQALYQPYMFLASKGQGKTIRNIAFTEAGINLFGNLIFIPIFGVFGAIYTSIAAKGVHLVLKYLAYQKFIKTHS